MATVCKAHAGGTVCLSLQEEHSIRLIAPGISPVPYATSNSLPFLEAHVLVLEVEGCLTDSCTSFRTVFGMPVSTCRTWRWHQAARRPRPGAITFFAGAAGLDQFRTSRLETEDGRERVFGERLEKEPRQLSQSHLCRARLTYANEPAASLHYLFVHKPRQRVLL